MTGKTTNGRFRLGILFSFSSGWMGGIIYVVNIIKTLNYLDEKEKPEILLFYKPELEQYVNGIDYPYLTTVSRRGPDLTTGHLKSILFRKNYFIRDILAGYTVDALFPIHDFPVRTKTDTKLIAWWADLQHKYYPEFFSKSQLLVRNIRIRRIMKNCDHLMVSSNAVKEDFKLFFKQSTGMQVHLYHFVSIIENQEELDIEELKIKYHLPDSYFLVSNQFHKHKNHKVTLEAVARLKVKGIKIHLAFTGKFPSAESSPYMTEIHEIIEKNQLHDRVTMLGMISRSEQLLIMRYSQAVIQPSLFEGWSTVIEDAIALQVPVIASSLKVNIEQLGPGNRYFDPHDAVELASILSDYPERNIDDRFYEDHSLRIKRAAKELLAILAH